MPRRPELVDPTLSAGHAFARMLIDRRVELGMSREKLASSIHYGATYVRDVEQARKLPPLEIALAMAQALGLDRERVAAAWADAAGSNPARASAAMTDSEPVEARSSDRHTPEVRPQATGRRRRFGARGVAVVIAAVAAILVVPGREPSTVSAPPVMPVIPLTPTTGPVQPFRDDFTTSSAWEVAAGERGGYTYVDGAYQISIRVPNRSFFSWAPTTRRWLNVKVEVDVAPMDGKESEFGVSCRMGTGPGSSRYAGLLSTGGRWEITRWDDSENARILARPRDSSQHAAVRRDAPNRVSLECDGGDAAGELVHLRLSVNGTPVAEASDPEGLRAGRVGLAAASLADPVPIDVRFDNFHASEKATSTATSAPTRS